MFQIIKKRTRSCYSRTDDHSREFVPNRSEQHRTQTSSKGERTKLHEFFSQRAPNLLQHFSIPSYHQNKAF